MDASRGRAARVGPATLIVALAILAVSSVASLSAGADSISCGTPGASSSSDAWNRADAVFTGSLSDPRNPGFLVFRDRRTSVVDAEVLTVRKGEAPTELTMFVSTCGPSLPTDRVVNVAVRRDDAGNYGFLDLLTDEQAASLGGTAPVADGVGPVRHVVSLDAGAFDLVALDGVGRALGFRAGSDPPRQVAVCPDGRTVVAWGSDPSLPSPDDPSIEVIDVASMSTTATLPLPRVGSVTFLACHDAAASRVTAFVATSPTGGSLVSIGPGEPVVTPTESRSPFGLDDRGNVVGGGPTCSPARSSSSIPRPVRR